MTFHPREAQSPVFRLVVLAQLVAILVTGVAAARPMQNKQSGEVSSVVGVDINKLAAGLGDTTPTDNTATSDPVSDSGEQSWLLAPVLVPESLRSIRFISPELNFASIQAPRIPLPIETILSSLGDISPLLPTRFALVGQRPSGTS